MQEDPHRNLHPTLMQKKKKRTGRKGGVSQEGASMNEGFEHVMT